MKRTPEEMTALLLKILLERAKTWTEIFFDLKTSGTIVGKKLEFCLEAGLVEQVDSKKPSYRITPKGIQWLEHFDAMRALEQINPATN